MQVSTAAVPGFVLLCGLDGNVFPITVPFLTAACSYPKPNVLKGKGTTSRLSTYNHID